MVSGTNPVGRDRGTMHDSGAEIARTQETMKANISADQGIKRENQDRSGKKI